MLLCAVLQLAVPPLAVAADAVATAESRGARAHVESTSDASCARVHDAECVFCQFLSAGAAPVGSPVPAPEAIIRHQVIAVEIDSPLIGEAGGVPLPRAPPRG